jgi:hypothetical protein
MSRLAHRRVRLGRMHKVGPTYHPKGVGLDARGAARH